MNSCLKIYKIPTRKGNIKMFRRMKSWFRKGMKKDVKKPEGKLQKENDLEIVAISEKVAPNPNPNKRRFNLDALCKTTAHVCIGKDMTEYGTSVPYVTVNSISEAVKGLGLENFHIHASPVWYEVDNSFKDNIEHQNKAGLFSMVFEIDTVKGSPEKDARANIELLIPITPSNKVADKSRDEWFVASLKVTVDVSFNSGDIFDIDAVKDICIAVANSVIVRSLNSDISKELMITIPNIIPSHTTEIPKVSSEERISTTYHYTTKNVDVMSMID